MGGPLSQVNPDDPGRAGDDPLKVGHLVVVELGREAESVPQRPGQQACPCRRPDKGERWNVDRDRGGPRALADDDVDAEVLHRQVEHLLGRLGHPVNLVKEEDLTGNKRGQDRSQVPRVLNGRAGGDTNRGGHLGRDDHGQGGLSKPWRSGQQDMVRGRTA